MSVLIWQRIEGLALFGAGLLLFWHWNVLHSWWEPLLLFFVPDLSFAAYLAGPKAGAFCYNGLHLYALGIGIMTVGLLSATPIPLVLGSLWMAHAGFDRMLGYGLKLLEDFRSTHLGRIGGRSSAGNPAAP